MADIQLRFVTNNGANTLTSTPVTITDANAARILAAEKINMGTADNQATVNALNRRFIDEMIGDTKTIERQATAVADIQVT